MNPVLILTHNCLEFTKRCAASALAQDIPTEVVLFDNGSSDGTVKWARESLPKDSLVFTNPTNVGVSFGWNFALKHLFDQHDHVLVVNNDTILPPYFYRKLLSYDLPFVSGISVREDPRNHPESWPEPAESPDFSAFLIRRDCWEKVGPFNEDMIHYCGDMDYHIRAHRAGVKLMNAGVPFYHERSSTIKHADPKDQRVIQLQADADREVFKEIYGIYPGDPAYNELFK